MVQWLPIHLPMQGCGFDPWLGRMIPHAAVHGVAKSRTQATQGNRLSCLDEEGRRSSEEAVPGPSVFHSGDPGVSGEIGRAHV